MNDNDYNELKLRAQIVPEQSRWSAPEYVHWQKLHAAADEARDRVGQAFALMDAIDADADLSPEGKERQRKKAAVQALADFEASKTLDRARKTVAEVVDQWNAKVGMGVKPPSDIHQATLHMQIRDRLAAMKGSKVAFLEENGSNSLVVSAILTAPAFLSGLNEPELALLRRRVEQHISPEIAEARDATVQALKEAEHGWQRAKNKIAERAGLTEGPDGHWADCPASDAA